MRMFASIIFAMILWSDFSYAERYGQLIFSFDSKRKISVKELSAAGALEIYFARTSPEELEVINFYDEALIKRAIITDLGPSGAKLKLYLKDDYLKASITEFDEPYRVAIDIYDLNYTVKNDPKTGLPLYEVRGTGTSSTESKPSGAKLSENRRSLGQVFSDAPGRDSSFSSSSGSKRKLAVPEADAFTGDVSEFFKENMAQVEQGRGKSWKDYPVYIYPLQTAIYQGRANPSGFKKRIGQQGMTEGQAMAEYGLKLFNFGHEKRALLAYQQVLRREPVVFDQDPLHLWALAEINFGMGNQSLASEYHQALIAKHPDTPLAVLAQIRLLDAKALYAEGAEDKGELASLVPSLKKISSRGNSEIELMLTLRELFWNDSQASAESTSLPRVDERNYRRLSVHYPNHEDSQTAFLTASLIMSHLVKAPWTQTTADFANAYFKSFSGKGTRPYVKDLEQKMTTKVHNLLRRMAADGKYLDVIEAFEGMPAALKTVMSDKQTAWALAESYRNLGKLDEAARFYETASKNFDLGLSKLKATFWASVITGAKLGQLSDDALTPAKIDSLKSKVRRLDNETSRIWSKLPPQEKRKFAISYKEYLEDNVASSNVLETPPKIILAQWTDSLSTTLDPTTSNDGLEVWKNSYSPKASTMALFQKLATRFTDLGQENNRVKTVELMRQLDPKDFEDDTEAKARWAAELSSLAEDYRKSNRYLDAGRLYKEVATKAENWERRSEALYKGGLLLYRAGRQDEALEALRLASQDGSNLFYQNLAKERLNQIEQ